MLKWKTPNTYDANFGLPTNCSGVYFFTVGDLFSNYIDIVYVGSSTNIKQRYNNHEVYRILRDEFPYKHIMFYFKNINKGFYDTEIKLIKALKPELNIVHK